MGYTDRELTKHIPDPFRAKSLFWSVHGHGLSMAMDCLSMAMDIPWPWTIHSHGQSMAMNDPWPWTVHAGIPRDPGLPSLSGLQKRSITSDILLTILPHWSITGAFRITGSGLPNRVRVTIHCPVLCVTMRLVVSPCYASGKKPATCNSVVGTW